MKWYWCLIMVFSISVNLYAQRSYYDGQSVYHLWVKYQDKSPGKKGYLQEIDLETISLVTDYQYSAQRKQYENLSLKIPISNIQSLQFREKGRIKKGVLWGGLIGGVALGLVTMASNEPCGGNSFCVLEFSDAEAFTIGFLGGSLGGMLVGAIISSSKITIPINGEIVNYNRQKGKLRKFLIN